MLIGFAGNANNYPLMLARALKRQGGEVRFLVTSRLRLDRPENRYPEYEAGYPDWVIDCGEIDFLNWLLPRASTRRALKLLRECDLVVLNQLSPTLAGRLARPWVALLTGSDLATLANPKYIDIAVKETRRAPRPLFRFVKRLLLQRLVAAQRHGIAEAGLVYTPIRGLLPAYDALLDGLGVSDDKREWLGMTEIDRIAVVPPPNNPTLRILCGARLNWVRPIPLGMSELDYKGTDVLLEGVAQFAKKCALPFELRLVRKGLHVAETEQLVRQLGLEGHVTWLNEMSQRAIQAEFEAADVVVDQLGNGFVGMVGLDAMATGRPVIANGRPEFYEPLLGEPSPICQATTAAEVADQLTKLTVMAERVRIGQASRAYVARHLSTDAAARRLMARAQRLINR
ncbi:MAG: glycosyltransferase [Candidatus Sericytochromatia bacterium]|nr:glycosyltransferase [Candidatus Sericytochromatia bacterium]